MNRRTLLTAVAGILMIVLCGAAAIAANVGILSHAEHDPVGHYTRELPAPSTTSAPAVPVTSKAADPRAATGG